MALTSTQIGAAALGLSAVGVGFQAYGLYQQSRAGRDQARYQAAVARNNQIIAEREAADIREQGEAEVATHRRKVNQLKGRQRAALAEQGIELGVGGTAEDILADTALLGELDVEQIRTNAERAAYGAEVQAMNFGAQAGLYDDAADAFNPTLTGMSSLLTGAGSVAAKWYDWQHTAPAKRISRQSVSGAYGPAGSRNVWTGPSGVFV